MGSLVVSIDAKGQGSFYCPTHPPAIILAWSGKAVQ